jgi:ketosteroid isomerase-like protein
MGANADRIGQAYEAFARQDIPAVLEAFDPKIDWTSPDSVRTGGHFVGPDEVVGFFSRLPEAYAELRVETDDVLEAGDRVVVLGHHVGKAANGDFDVPFAHVWTLRDGKAVRFVEYFDTARINAAIGD